VYTCFVCVCVYTSGCIVCVCVYTCVCITYTCAHTRTRYTHKCTHTHTHTHTRMPTQIASRESGKHGSTLSACLPLRGTSLCGAPDVVWGACLHVYARASAMHCLM